MTTKIGLAKLLVSVAAMTVCGMALAINDIDAGKLPPPPQAEGWKFDKDPYFPGMLSYQYAYPSVYHVYSAQLSCQVAYFFNTAERVAADKSHPFSRVREEMIEPFESSGEYNKRSTTTTGDYRAIVYARKNFYDYGQTGEADERLPLIKVIYYHPKTEAWASLNFEIPKGGAQFKGEKFLPIGVQTERDYIDLALSRYEASKGTVEGEDRETILRKLRKDWANGQAELKRFADVFDRCLDIFERMLPLTMGAAGIRFPDLDKNPLVPLLDTPKDTPPQAPKPETPSDAGVADNSTEQQYERGRQAAKAKDYATAWKELLPLAEAGNAEAQNQIGMMSFHGLGADADRKKAAKWFKLGADAGNPSALSNYGLCLREGDGVPMDRQAALAAFRKAADQGYARGQYLVGAAYQFGKGVPEDTEEAVRWYRLAAEQGYMDAQYSVGFAYDFGRGIGMDQVKATAWYEKAAEQGHPSAQHNLGAQYEEGEGVDKDLHKAFLWRQKAADQGYAVAQNWLGVMYEDGVGTTPDVEKAFSWYLKAAQQGNSNAQNRIGRAYYEGWGVAKDVDEAMRWIQMAADQGDETAAKNLEILQRLHGEKQE